MRNACDYVNPVFAAQGTRPPSHSRSLSCQRLPPPVFEYKTANYIGKGMESFFGFISVLPGAFRCELAAAAR